MGLNHYADRPHSLKDLIQSAINRNGYFAFNRVNADIKGENIVLTGTVETYYQKQLAQETVRKVSETISIENRIQVVASAHMEMV